MATDVELANRSLTLCGAARISALTDNTKSGTALAAVYTQVRDACLATANWKFAMRRFNPAASDTPLFGFTYAYVVPDEILRLVEIKDIFVAPSLGARYLFDQGLSPFNLEEDKRILTDFGPPLNCRGVARIENSARFDPLFATYFCHELALAVWEDVSRKSSTKKADVERERDRSLKIARARDAIIEPPEELPDDTWTLSRIGP